MNKHYCRFISWTIIFLSTSCLFAQWEPDDRLTFNDSISSTFLNYAWCIGAAGDTVHIVWDDTRDGHWEVYYIRSLNAGLTWELDTRLSDYPDCSMHPAIGVSGSNVHTIWSDERDGNYEIYYKRDPTGNAVSEANACRYNTGIGNFSILPSPFHKRVSLKYSLVNNVDVSLKVYDISGRLIKTLVDEEKTTGTYSVQWDASPLRPGVYFIALNDQITKKLVKAR
ncbi:MAG: T9SS type A sorting domain-containing protein [bacterium]